MRPLVRLFLSGVLAMAWSTGAPAQPAATGGVDLERMARIEREDFRITPPRELHQGVMHGPTPSTIPGGQVITTQGLVALAQRRDVAFAVIDVLGQAEQLPNAIAGAWLSQPGTFDDPIQAQAAQWLAQLTRGRKDAPLVFYCLSRECWMSYNAALRAIRAGYTNVLWYRGGLEAWKAAGLPTQPAGSPGMPAQAPGGAGAPGGVAARGAGNAPGLPAGFVAVQPGAPPARPSAAPPSQSSLSVVRGRYFAFAVPPGWRVGEEGQFAVSLLSPDTLAATVMVGNSGLPLNTPPDQFAYRKLSASQPRQLALGGARAARPAAGFSQAVEYDVTAVSSNGMSVKGVAKVSMAPGYDSTVMVVTAAIAAVEHWPQYASWLPLVAEQVSATDGNAFGRRGIMAQNLQNSTAFGEALSRYRDWSQRNWQGVTDQRNASVDRRNAEFRENLGAVNTWNNPFGGTPPVELSTQHSYYWMDRQGQVVGTNDPSADPNVGATGDWRRMERIKR